jgi:hypothetical protein
MKEFLRRAGLMVNRCGPDRRRALRHRLREIGFDVTRIVMRATVVTVWEVNLRVDYVDQMPPPVGPFRARLRRALRALGYRCPERDVRIRLRGDRLKLTFPWPER